MKTLLRALGVFLFNKFKEPHELDVAEAQALAEDVPDLKARLRNLDFHLVETLEAMARLEDEAAAATKKKPAPRRRSKKSD